MNPKPASTVRRRGIVFIVSAPSGTGKTTLINGLRVCYPEIDLSISCTTRAQRHGERHGLDYRFVSRREFIAMRSRGAFAEWAQVHGFLYGTPRRPLERCLRTGCDILLDIDVQGAKKIKRSYPEAVLIFILPPSRRELQRRLALRGLDRKDAIQRRLARADDEIREIFKYDYFVVNQDVRKAVRLLECIVKAERAKISRVHQWRIDRLRNPRGGTDRGQRTQNKRPH